MKKKFLKMSLLFLVFTLLIGSVLSVSAEQPEKLWEFKTEDDVDSSPTVSDDGTIYVGNDDGVFYALDSDGSKKWEVEVSGAINVKPRIDGNTIYITTHNGYVYAISDTGEVKWEYLIKENLMTGNPVVGDDGTLYIGTDYSIKTFDPEGENKWTFDIGYVNRIPSSFELKDGENLIYAGSDKGYLHIIDTDGNEKESYLIDADNPLESPAVAEDGTIYLGSDNGKVYAINRDGTEKWTFNTNKKIILAEPIIGEDGTIYVGYDYDIFALNPDGSLKWSYYLGLKNYVTTDIVLSEDKIYFASDNGMIYALNNSGEEEWTFSAGDKINSTPEVTEDVIYFGSADNKIYAIENK